MLMRNLKKKNLFGGIKQKSSTQLDLKFLCFFGFRENKFYKLKLCVYKNCITISFINLLLSSIHLLMIAEKESSSCTVVKL